MTTAQERLRKMDTLFNLIIAANPAIEKALIAQYCCKTGLAERKVQEYIRLMVDAGKVERDLKGQLWLKK